MMYSIMYPCLLALDIRGRHRHTPTCPQQGVWNRQTELWMETSVLQRTMSSSCCVSTMVCSVSFNVPATAQAELHRFMAVLRLTRLCRTTQRSAYRLTHRRVNRQTIPSHMSQHQTESRDVLLLRYELLQNTVEDWRLGQRWISGAAMTERIRTKPDPELQVVGVNPMMSLILQLRSLFRSFYHNYYHYCNEEYFWFLPKADGICMVVHWGVEGQRRNLEDE